MSKKRRKSRHRRPPSFQVEEMSEVLTIVEMLRDEGRLEDALEVLERAPSHLQRRPELLLARATLYLDMGEDYQAIEPLERILRIKPVHLPAAALLVGLYLDYGWVSHAARIARRVLDHPDRVPADVLSRMREALEEAEGVIRENAAQGGVPFERMERACHLSEKAERWVWAGEFEEAARLYARVIETVPTWLAPHNNLAQALCMVGQVEEAIRIAEDVLRVHPDNLHAVANLVRFHLTRGEREKAEEYAARLKQLPIRSVDHLAKAVEALGFLEDDEGLYELYRRHRKMVGDLDAISLLNLGSAAANLGHPQVARRLWRMAHAAGAPLRAFDLLLDALDDGAPGPGSAPRYPTVALPQLIHVRQLEALARLQLAWEEGRISEKVKEKRVNDLVKRMPYLLQALTKLLWEEEAPLPVIRFLAFIGTPAAVEILREFGFSQAGELGYRLAALEALADLGVVDVEEPLKVWDEEHGEWVELRLAPVKITMEVELLPYDEEVWKRINEGAEALQKGDLEEACRQLEAALALDPEAAVAHHNLGVALQRLGKPEEAFEHLQRAVEIVPDYPYGCCTLAHYYMDRGDLEEAEEVLAHLLDRRQFHPEEWIYYQRTLARLMLERGEYKAAQEHAQIVLDMRPDDEEALRIMGTAALKALRESPEWQETQRRRLAREQEKRRRPIRSDARLAECLERLTKDALVGTARAMPTRRKYNVRKAVLIQDLAEYLPNPDVVREIVEGLSEEERQALRDVLEAGGMMDWEAFAARYGDDLDESPYWDYREPETVMGRLRMLGLLSEGTVDDRFVVLIPYELRELLPPALEVR